MAEIIDLEMRLTDKVTRTLGNIRNSMEQTAKMNKRLGNSLRNAGRNITSLADSMMPLAAGIAGVGALGVKTFMDFDQIMVGAATKAGATEEEMQQMKNAAAEMGAKFPTTAKNVALAMDRLAAGGFNASQTIKTLPGIIEASIASGEDLANTSNVITSALSIWNLTTGDVEANTRRVADVVQATSNASKMDMQAFGLAMQYAGAPAAALGIQIEELGTAMGIMANNGLEASTIGTSLRSTLSRLASPPAAAAKAMASLGITMADFQKGDGSFIGLSRAVDVLRNKMQGLSDVQQVAALKAIAGEEAYSGLLALIRTSPEAYRQMTDTISKSQGSSHAAYIKMQDTLKGSIDALMSSVEALGISFGSALAPTIREAAGALKGIADTFTNLSPETKQLIIHVGEGIIAFTGLTYAVGKAVSISGTMMRLYGEIGLVLKGQAIGNKALQFGIQGAVKGFGLLKAAGAALLGPMGLVVAGIALAAFIIYRNWDKIAPFMKSCWDSIKGAFTSAIDTIRPALDALKGAWDTLVNAFTGSSGSFSLVNGVFRMIAGTLTQGVIFAVKMAAAIFTGALVPAIRIVGTIVQTAIGIFAGLINFVTGVFTGDWTLAWNGVVSIFSSVFGGIRGIAESVMDGVKGIINNIIDAINGISVTIPDWVPNYGGQTFSPNITKLAKGTGSWMGGPVVINEKGGELVDLPNGTRVIPHDQSVRTAYDMGARSGGSPISINISGVTITNGQDVTEFARQVAREIQYQMEKEAINSVEGAI